MRQLSILTVFLVFLAMVSCAEAEDAKLSAPETAETADSSEQGAADFSAAPGTVKLPDPKKEGAVSVEQAIQERRSVRSFKEEPITLEDVSQILWASGGKTVDGVTGPTRSYPSAGGIYPLEIYLIAGNVSGLATGIYKYDWKEHSLDLITRGDFRIKLSIAAMRQNMIREAPVAIVITAQTDKTESRYGTRGATRYVSMDAGHLGQNVHLQAVAMGLGTVMVGALDEGYVKEILGVEKDGETPVYIMPIGYPK